MEIEKIDTNVYEISPFSKENFEMKVPVHVYANDTLLEQIKQDKTLEQITNVACLPGVKKHVIALSDAHQGYGFCIGGVAGTERNEGMISPGGVGYDINCGVRLIRTNLYYKDVQDEMINLIDTIAKNVPSGLGSKGKINLNKKGFNSLLENGLDWALESGYAVEEDLEHCEENGRLKQADSDLISKKAYDRGITQVGSLGSGNHFLEVQKIDHIYDKDIAKQLGLQEENQVTCMVHTGSRAFGHQVCTDSLRNIEKAMKKYDIDIPDRELACVPANTEEAERYLKVMACAANFGFCNRQLITHWVRESFESVFDTNFEELDMHLIYDVCHNILKKEEHKVNGKKEILNVHRKGATRALPKDHPEVPQAYRAIGQPVLIPGTMGTASYLCVGRSNAMEMTFGSTAHGAGRVMSRNKADKKYPAQQVKDDLSKKGIYVKGASMRVIAEESPGAYKDVNQVVAVNHNLDIIKRVARLIPLGVIKG